MQIRCILNYTIPEMQLQYLLRTQTLESQFFIFQIRIGARFSFLLFCRRKKQAYKILRLRLWVFLLSRDIIRIRIISRCSYIDSYKGFNQIEV